MSGGDRTLAFTEHLKKLGKFGEFKKRRKALEVNGLTRAQAWETAAEEFGIPASSPAGRRS